MPLAAETLELLLSRLSNEPDLSKELTFFHLQHFLYLARHLLPVVCNVPHDFRFTNDILPEFLVAAPLRFLAAVLDLPEKHIAVCWGMCRDLLLSVELFPDHRLDDFFRLEGVSAKIGSCSILPAL